MLCLKGGKMIKKIENKAVAKLEICDEEFEIVSNTVTTKPIKIRIEKKQNCDVVFIGENVKYTVEIENQCSTDVENLIFKDELDKCLEFVKGSFRVNGKVEAPEIKDNTIIFKIDKLESCETLVITFEAKATDDCCECKHKPKSEKPTVQQVKHNDNSVRGTGVPQATVYVEFPDGKIVSAVVNNGGNWNISAPDRLTDGQTVYVWQLETGKGASDTVEVIVVR
jgi:uncharacterized repeat protein (TIGR01451 family)